MKHESNSITAPKDAVMVWTMIDTLLQVEVLAKLRLRDRIYT